MTIYPAQIDNTQTLPTAIDNLTPVQGVVVNRLRDAILAIEYALGTNPNGIYGSVAARLGALETTTGNLQIITLAGDLGGTIGHPLVIGIQGFPVANIQPILGDVLVWNGIAWVTSQALTNHVFTAGGDLSGNGFFQTVTGLQNHPINATPPTNGQVLQWNGTDWVPTNITTIPSGPAGLDLGGTYPNPTVTGLRGIPLAIASPGNNQVLQFNAGTGTWGPANATAGITQLTGDVIAGPGSGTQATTIISAGGFPIITQATTAGGDLIGNYPNPTIRRLQGTTLTLSSPSNGQGIIFNGTAWVNANVTPTGAASGDLGGSYPAPQVFAIRQQPVSATTPVSGNALAWSGSIWQTTAPGGDLSGTYANATVTKIQNNAILAGIPTDGYVLTWNNTAGHWQGEAITTGSVTLGGDVTGAANSNHVVAIQSNPVSTNVPTTGNSLIWNGSLWLPSALNLAGGANFVTGALPNANQAPQSLTLSGDVSGTGTTASTSVTVTQIQTNPVTAGGVALGQFLVGTGSNHWAPTTISGDIGSSVSTAGRLTVNSIQGVVISGTPTNGQILKATSGVAASWQSTGGSGVTWAGDLTGSTDSTQIVAAIHGTTVPATPTAGQTLVATSGSAAIWELLPVASLAHGTAGQVLLNNATPIPTWTTVGGDSTISATGVITNTGLQSNPVPSPTGTNTVLTWTGSAFNWGSSSAGITQLTGDVLAGPGSGSVGATVVALQGFSVAATAPTDGYVLEYLSGAWRPTPAASGSFLAGGDLSGSSTNQIVIGIDTVPLSITSLTTGNVLQYNGTDWVNAPINLAGGANFITGILPSANQAAQTMSGDVTGTTAVSTVARIQGNTITPGALTKGQFLVASSTSNWAATSLSGDLLESGITSGQVEVAGLLNNPLPGLADGYLFWDGAAFNWVSISSGSGITQLTGDVLAGPGTGSIPATVAALQNNPVQSGILSGIDDGYVLTWKNSATQWQALPSSTFTPSGTGIPHIIGGVLQPTATPIDLASADITGILPFTKQQSQILTGDVTGSTNANVVAALQGNAVENQVLTATQDGYVLTWDSTFSRWEAIQPQSGPPSGPAGGDLAGFYPSPIVAALQGNPVQNSGVPADGYVLTYNAGAGEWQPEAITSGSVTLGGDVTGPVNANTVNSIQGIPIVVTSPTTGNTLQFNGTDFVNAPTNLAGGAGAVTGVLPAGNMGAQPVFGDVTGNTSGFGTTTVSELQGNSLSLPTLGSTQDGYVLTWDFLAGLLEMKPTTSPDLFGDVIGPTASTTISAIQGYPINLGILGAGQDGYVLTWNNSIDQLVMEASTAGNEAALQGDVTGPEDDNTLGQRKTFLLMGA